MSRRAALAVVALGLLLGTTSCAYYNTYYLAKKYYNQATLREPYIVDKDKADPGASGNFRSSVTYSKKVLAQYPKSKWVDDAYLLWARALLFDDPLQTVNMLQDFTARYPKSPVTPEARFYLGVAYRLGRKYGESVKTLDEYLTTSPKHALVPYAFLERSRALGALDRWADAALSAKEILDKYPKSELITPARLAHAEAAFNQGDFAAARADYVTLGRQAVTDEERLTYLFRESDCLEGAHQYDEELHLLQNAQAHEVPPPSQEIAPGAPAPPPPPNDRYGRIMIRIGTAHLLAGHLDPALIAYRSVVKDYPRTAIAAEAQYRVGYAYETQADDFARARDEYLRIKDTGAAQSVFQQQGEQRAANLAKITQFKGTGRDTVESKAEARFLLAEQYLFQLNKPDRAIQEYDGIASDFAGTPWAAKALVARGWVLARKLDRRHEADSLWWEVVYRHPATEAQLAARDYLEKDGATVADSLIKLPEKPLIASTPVDTALTPPPAFADSLGVRPAPGTLGSAGRAERQEILREQRLRRQNGGGPGPTPPPPAPTTTPTPTSTPAPVSAAADSAARQGLPWSPPPDSSGVNGPPAPPPPPPMDTTSTRPRHGG